MARPEHPWRHALGLLLTAFVCALALGAAWALVAARFQHPAWLAAAAAVGMALAMRLSSRYRGRLDAVLAAAGTLFAALYAETLQLAVRIAVQFGLSLLEVLRTSGAIRLGDLAWHLMPASRLGVYLLAALLAAILVWPKRPTAR